MKLDRELRERALVDRESPGEEAASIGGQFLEVR